MIRLGITGTDTGVGKTMVGCAIAAGLRRRGLRVAAMKPVETGVAFDDESRDGMRLAKAAGAVLPLSIVAPLVFADPIAPLAAARRSRSSVDLNVLDHTIRTAVAECDALLVEGAGGLLVPIADRLSFDGLFARWNLDVLVVAANRLGVINHTRLTIAAARAAGLVVRAVALNNVKPSSDTSARENGLLIAELEDVPVVELPWLADTDELDSISDLLLPHVISELELAGGQGARR
ncbi:MAG TPA: dethiobiotin synthase [Gemmatimonadaceae bacterium]|nr:dethiobiotin synthase [Gemmatimonadaceae bacterium]